MTDQITVLRCASNLVLTKTHSATGTTSYGRPKWFRLDARDVSSVHDLHDLLGDLAGQRSACVIRGQFLGADQTAGMVYDDEPVWRADRKQVRRVAMAFKDAPVHWLSLDIDGWTGASVDPVEQPEAAVSEWIETHLPAAFHDVTCAWQLSASAGVSAGLRAHLWFWMAKPATGAQLKAWAKGLSSSKDKTDRVDESFFENVRVHYTADPVFEGVADPVPGGRLGMIDGLFSDEVDLDLGAAPVEDDAVVPFDDDDDIPDLTMDEVVAMRPPLGLSRQAAKDMVFALPDDEFDEYAKWLKIGMALHHEFSGSDEGMDLFDEFSRERTPEDYDHDELVEKWKSFGRSSGSPVTMASIKDTVRKYGYDFGRCQERLGGATTYREAVDIVSQFDLSETEMDTVLPRLVELCKESGRAAKPGAVKKEVNAARKEQKSSNGEGAEYLEKWLADMFLRKYRKGGRERLLCMAGAFWVYDKGVWREQDRLAVKAEVLEFLDTLRQTHRDEGALLFKTLKESGRDTTLNALSNALVDLVAAMVTDPRDPDPLRITSTQIPSVMNCRNGELWFDDDGEVAFHKHDPDNRFVCQIGTEYDPDAACPEWDKSLVRIMREHSDSEDVIRHLHEIGGYLLQQSRHLPVWVMFYGGGSNGKSFVSGILQEVMGPHAWSAGAIGSYDDTKNAHVGHDLVGKQMLVDDDYAKGAVLPDGLMKKLSEEKPMTADPKYGKRYNFICRATPLILTNSWPKTRDLSQGLVRRAQIFRFNSTIDDDEADIGLGARIRRDELPGVLNRFIEGWQRVKRRGRFKKPQSCIDAEQLWLQNRHALGAFMRECLTVTGDPKDRVKGTDVFNVFAKWKMHEGIDLRYGRNTFYEEIGQAKGVDRIVVDHAQTFSGLVISNDMDPTGLDFDD